MPRTQRSIRIPILALAIAAAFRQAAAQNPPLPPDPYQWLEDVSGERSMAWVKAENERTAAILKHDPRFATFEAVALQVLESPERLPIPAIRGNNIYNNWQDAAHPRGILRRTSATEYLKPQPTWETLIDFDSLGKQDNQKWVARGRICLYPGDELCMIGLSAGGEDAVTMREFNLKTRQFVPGGFVLPRSKQTVTWLDRDTLLVVRDWGAGTMAKSGYPFIEKLWKRGQPLDQATEVYRGKQSDLAVEHVTLHDTNGDQATFLFRGLNFFQAETHLLDGRTAKLIALPLKSKVIALVKGRVIVSLDEDWKPEPDGKNFVAGSLVALDFSAFRTDPMHLKPALVFAPTSTEFLQGVQATRNHLLLTTLENVEGRAYTYSLAADGHWTGRKLPVPDHRTVSLVSANWSDDRFFLTVTGFLTPSSLFLGDAAAGTLKEVKALPPQFDASPLVVEQLSATSKDGTKVPYFVVRRKDMRFDGSNPTLLYAYGGFQVSETPDYHAPIGKLWLERGGVFVLANIRGGGEFGPAWHEAGLKTHRQRIYDDFAAVGQDLVTRRITSPRRLGILGGSNGGLLMGVEMTQHPEMWNAIIIEIPLLDMLRYEHIAAGASWVGEYGSVSVPEERAFLESISPYHQLKANVNYPEPLILTTSKDDRVGPVHARKFAAKLEGMRKPFFFQEITEGGHGTGADPKEQAETFAFQYTYLSRKLMD
jgi:prolyl oligopeptidase